MQKQELVKGMGYLGIALGKEYTEEECEVFYDFLKGFSYQVFIKAIKNRIKKSPYPPKINELIEECNSCNEDTKFKVIEFMKAKGYFKTTNEYDKAMLFTKRGIVPKWLQDDMNKYYKLMQQPQIGVGGNLELQQQN